MPRRQSVPQVFEIHTRIAALEQHQLTMRLIGPAFAAMAWRSLFTCCVP